DVAERRDAELDAWASEVLAEDQLLDDSAPLSEPLDIGVVGQARQLEPQVLQPLANALALPRRSGLGQALPVPGRVPFTGDPLVLLDQRRLHPGLLRAQRGDRPGDLLEAREALDPDRMGNVLLREEAAAAALAPEREEARVRSVHWDPEAQREAHL